MDPRTKTLVKTAVELLHIRDNDRPVETLERIHIARMLLMFATGDYDHIALAAQV